MCLNVLLWGYQNLQQDCVSSFMHCRMVLNDFVRCALQILRRQNVRYDDQRGPVLLVFLLACALVASTVITAKSAFGTF